MIIRDDSEQNKQSHKAFTLMEVLVALAVVTIGLAALIRLQLFSLNMSNRAELTTRAALLADEKISETLGAGYPQIGVATGTINHAGCDFQWKRQVTNPQSPQLAQAHLTGLRRLSVNVTWQQGGYDKHVQLTTYVARRSSQ